MNRFCFYACLLISFHFSAQINLSSSLTACYALNGNVNDPINALTGTLSAVTPTVDRLSNLNSAYSFSGTASSYIELPDDPLLKPSNAISFSCWVKTNIVLNQYIIFTKNNSGSNFEAYTLNYNTLSGPLKFRLQKGASGSTTIIDGTATVSVGSWHHVVGTIDATNLNLYVDGALDQTGTTSIPFTYAAGKTVILGGSNEAGFNLPLNGSIDNVRFYNRVLNAAEVNQIYSTDPMCLGGPPPVASFSAASTSVCAGNSVSLTDFSSNSPSSWLWTMAGATPSTSAINNPTIAYPNPGTYTISLVATNSFGSSSPYNQVVTVNALPAVTSSTSNSLICQGNSALLVANGANTYTWSTSQSFQAINVSPTVSTTYSVVGTDSNGCQNTSSILITVSLCTSLAESFLNSHFEVYPNPTTGKFILSCDQKIKTIVLFNLLGEIVFKVNDVAAQLDLSNYPNGIYFLQVNVDGKILTKKLVKE